MPVKGGPGAIGREISHLMNKRDGMEQRQAVAASLNMARKGRFGKSERKAAGRAPSRGSR